MDGPGSRLPQTVLPDDYEIHLSPDFSTDTFEGREAIAVRLMLPSATITLHATEIDFIETTVTASGSTQRATVTHDEAREMVTVTVPIPIPAGPATLDIRFVGRLNDKLRGFYLSRANGRKYAVTQLEATDARRAFPSFDEPALKATFALAVTVDAGDTAISNGRLLSDTPGPGPGKHTLRFSTTAKMSSYLVALAVGNFECISGGSDGVPIRICATPDKKSQLGYALQAAEFILRFFNRYYAIPYPFEKLDILAVPDFAAGAMENTGAIFFRERLLLLEERTASTDLRKQIAGVISHEIAHQWFGNLVTMEWWDDIWLNEGFATWMERKPLAEWRPEWRVELDDERDTQSAMSLDLLRSTRAIRTRVETPAEINQVFDAIAYEKSAAVLRMVEAYVGSAAFRNGVNAYLRKYAYRNATAEGFWTAMAAASGKPVDAIMSSFVIQRGVPLVSVATACSGENTSITLAQQRLSTAASPSSTVWQIPVCFKRPELGKPDPVACHVLTQPVQTVTLTGCSSWLFANANGLGYYRSAYDGGALEALGAALRSGALTPVEQISLLEDEWALVRLGREELAAFLSLGGELVRGPLSPAVSTVTNRINSSINDHLVAPGERGRFQAWVRQLLRPLARALGWDATAQDTPERRSLRAAVLFTLGYAGRDPEVLDDARRRMTAYLDQAVAIDPDLFGTVVPLAAINGDAALYERYLARSRQASESGEQYRFRNALAFFTDPALRRRTLDYAISPEIRAQDAPQFISALLASPQSQQPTWEHLKANWTAITQSLGIFQGLPAVVRATGNFCDAAAARDIREFFEVHNVPGTERVIQQALESIETCAAMKAQQAPNLLRFLASTGN